MMTASISIHLLSFFRKANNPRWVRAECSCGWNAEGKAAEVYGKAARHDLDVPEGKSVA